MTRTPEKSEMEAGGTRRGPVPQKIQASVRQEGWVKNNQVTKVGEVFQVEKKNNIILFALSIA